MDGCEQIFCLGKPLPSEIKRALGYLSAMTNKSRQKGRKELALRFVMSGSLLTLKRSICVYGPHPSTEMSPVLLRSLGKRFHWEFGWQRANFPAIDNPSPLKSCAGCRVARSCSRECQKADWSSHKTMCKTLALKKAGSLPLGSDPEESLRPDGQYRCERCEQ